MSLFVDVHCHLEYDEFDADRDAVITRAKEAGVVAILNAGLNHERNLKTLAIAERYDIVRACLGLYPLDAQKLSPQELDEEVAFIRKRRDTIAAVGEVGLDYHWEKDESRRALQKEAFARMIELSHALRKPLVVHSREAEVDVIAMLEENGAKRVLLHCFGGAAALAKRGIANGWSFSIPPNITVSSHFRKLAKTVPMSQLLTETDAPFLGPVPKTRNEPANVRVAIGRIAKAKGLDPAEAERMVYMNYRKLFG
ncbi:TatD family hydrolase [Candidatus Woesearchaeota archaeon]|nr:TatD family hydrolase [Candidatus Woesearchaeota archaeon]